MKRISKTGLLKVIPVLIGVLSVALFLPGTWFHGPFHATPAGPNAPAQGPVMDPQAAAGHQIKVLAKALAENPGHTPVLLQLAKLETEKGNYPDAVLHLREILVREPDNAEARLELGKALYQKGDLRGALDQTQEILKKHPSHPDALYNLGAIYGNLGNTERAAEYWKRLIALDPNSESGRRAQQMLPQLEPKGR
jgi:Flp pilus assembly protein TadD